MKIKCSENQLDLKLKNVRNAIFENSKSSKSLPKITKNLKFKKIKNYVKILNMKNLEFKPQLKLKNIKNDIFEKLQ